MHDCVVFVLSFDLVPNDGFASIECMHNKCFVMIGYSWDPVGTDFDTGEDSNTAPTTVSADGRLHHQDRSTISDNESLLDTDFAEDDLDASDYLESVKPPDLFQDTVASKAHDEYIMHSTISKRFSDYIPTAVLDAYIDEEKSKLAKQFNTGEEFRPFLL